MSKVDEFERLRPLLFSIAYRILGSVAEAEDAVQESWLRYADYPAEPSSARAFRSTVVTRISINMLRSARHRREAYVGAWFPEPLLEEPYGGPGRCRAGRLGVDGTVSNPDKLGHVGPVADGWAVVRETLAARRRGG